MNKNEALSILAAGRDDYGACWHVEFKRIVRPAMKIARELMSGIRETFLKFLTSLIRF